MLIVELTWQRTPISQPPCQLSFAHPSMVSLDKPFSPVIPAYWRLPQARLNDTCINGCATLLYSAFMPVAVRCAILSTHDLPRVHFHADDDSLWRNASWTHFWEKPVWIIPIHRSLPGHWVLCTVDFSSRKLLLFDSLAEQKPWKNEIKVSQLCKLILS